MAIEKMKTTVSKTVKTDIKSAGATVTESVNADTATVAPVNVIRRKELVDRIVERSGTKPNLVKSVLDAVLEEIGDVLSSGDTIHVPPLGKLSVNRRKELPDGDVVICKLRRKTKDMEPPVEAAE